MSRFQPRIVLLFVLVAIMLRAALPVGYMPDFGSGKLFSMTICTVNGPQTVTLDDHFNPVKHKPDGHVDKECPFALLQQAVIHDDFVGQAFTAAFGLEPAHEPVRALFAPAHDACACVAQPRAPPALI